MKVIVDLCIIPIGVGTSLSIYIAECVRIIEASELKYNLHAYGTNIEGDWDRVFDVIKHCHRSLHDMGAPRISTTIKVGTNTDRIQSIDDKIKSVSDKI